MSSGDSIAAESSIFMITLANVDVF